jgi:hypothetical protein
MSDADRATPAAATLPERFILITVTYFPIAITDARVHSQTHGARNSDFRRISALPGDRDRTHK